TILVSALIFAVIFKVLPDAKIRWKDIVVGALVTAILFLLGKFVISFYISHSHVSSTYGAAGAVRVPLIWIYYFLIILYVGAEFTKVYALKYGDEIRPNDYAVSTRKIEVESETKSIQQQKNLEEKENTAKQRHLHRTSGGRR